MTWSDLRRVAFAGACISLLLLVIGIPIGITHGTLRTSSDLIRLSWPLLLAGAVLPAVLAPGLLLRLRVADGTITQLALGKQLSTRPISELREFSLQSGIFPVVLTFRDGTRMRLFGCHRRERLVLLERLALGAPELLVKHATMP